MEYGENARIREIERKIENGYVNIDIGRYDNAREDFLYVTKEAPSDYRGWKGLLEVHIKKNGTNPKDYSEHLREYAAFAKFAPESEIEKIELIIKMITNRDDARRRHEEHKASIAQEEERQRKVREQREREIQDKKDKRFMVFGSIVFLIVITLFFQGTILQPLVFFLGIMFVIFSIFM